MTTISKATDAYIHYQAMTWLRDIGDVHGDKVTITVEDASDFVDHIISLVVEA